jgi:hypothetical protein
MRYPGSLGEPLCLDGLAFGFELVMAGTPLASGQARRNDPRLKITLE